MGAVAADRGHEKSLSGRLQAEAELARELGVSLRRLHGWEPSTTTVYEYDDQGRVIRATTTRETEWTPDGVAILIASRIVEAERGPHGIAMDVALDPRASRFYHGDDRIEFEVIGPTVDHATDLLEVTKAAYYKHWGDDGREAHNWQVRLKD